MPRRCGLILAAALFPVFLPVSSDGQKPADEKKPVAADKGAADKRPVRTDLYGDPLPAGAIARLGTLRLRHPRWVSSVSFSPDGKTLVSGGQDRTIRFWELESGKLVRKIPAPHWSRTDDLVLYCPDGKTVASTSYGSGGAIRLWEASTGKPIRTFLETGGGSHKSLAFSKDGKLLAAAGLEFIFVWNIADGSEFVKFRLPNALVYSLSLSAGGQLLCSGHSDGTVRFWDMAKGRELAEQRRTLSAEDLGRSTEVLYVDFSPDGGTVAVRGEWGWLHLLDRTDKNRDRKIGKGTGRGQAVSYDFNTAVLGGLQDFSIWDIETGMLIRKIPVTGLGLSSFLLSGDATKLVTLTNSEAIRIWDTKTGTEILADRGHESVSAFVFSSDSKTLQVADQHGIHLWDPKSGKKRRFVRPSYNGRVKQFSPDGRWASGWAFPDGPGGVDAIWDPFRAGASKPLEIVPIPTLFSFSNDGHWAASIGFDRLGMWNLEQGRERHHLKILPQLFKTATQIAFTQDAKQVAVYENVPYGYVIHFWDVTRGQSLPGIKRQEPKAKDPQLAQHIIADGMAFCPDGVTLMTLAKEPDIWDLPCKQKIYSLRGMRGGVHGALSPDGNLRAYYSSTIAGVNVRVLEMATGDQLCVLEGHEDGPRKAVFSPDGRLLATAGYDSTVLVWDVLSLPGLAEENRGAPLSTKELDKVWADLDHAQGTTGFRAVCRLALAPNESVPYLKARLRPAAAREGDRIRQWISELDNAQFKVRDAANKELDWLCVEAEFELRRALRTELSAESRQRIMTLLASIPDRPAPSGWLRQIRAVQVLDYAGTSEARTLLQTLAAGSGWSRQTRDAQAVLERFKRQAQHR